MKVLTLVNLIPNSWLELSQEVKHMPIVVRHEGIKLPESELRKDLLYSKGLEEGKQLGLKRASSSDFKMEKSLDLKEGLLKDAQ